MRPNEAWASVLSAAWKVLLLAMAVELAGTLSAQAAEAQWRSLPIRSKAEFEKGLPGGEAEQHAQGMTRSFSNPDRIYLSHDVGQVWRSDDNGHTWHHPTCKGMYVRSGQSIEVDPVNADVVLAIVSCSYDHLARNFQGLYRSEDAGASWTLVLKLPEVDHQRSMQRTIAWDPTSLTGSEAKRWYAGFAGKALYRSEDGGRTWTQVRGLDEHRPLYGVASHPTRSGVLYVYSQRGLFVSEDGGVTLLPLGDLPKGEVRSLDINRANPSDMYATVDGAGLFRSRDGGQRFRQVKQFNAQYVVVHPTDRSRIYLVGRRGAHMLTSRDEGVTWRTPKVIPLPGWGRESGGWKTQINGQFSILLPDPRNPDSAVGIANATLYRTDDGGRTFTDTSAGFTGYSWGWFTKPVLFDVADPNRFAFLCYDVGMVVTDNGGKWFESRHLPRTWKPDGLIAHTGMYSGDFQPTADSQVIVASAGLYWHDLLVRSEDSGRTWAIIDDTRGNNLYVAFHTRDPKVVYADNKRSDDGGRTFRVLRNIPDTAVILGMAPSHPDTVYAMNGKRTELYRSDNRGATWRLYAKPGWPMMKLDTKPTFLVCPGDQNRVYTIDSRGDLATFDGKVWRSLGVLDRAGGRREQRNFVRQVAVDPRRPEIIYAGLHAAGRPFLFRSIDAGRTWEDISGNLPRVGIGGLVVHPQTGDVFTGGCTGTRVLAPPYESPKAIYHRLTAP